METKEISKKIDKRIRPQAEVLIDQLKLMAEKLDKEGERIICEKLVVDYDNGGGQSGVRENPFFPAYEKLLATYTKTLQAVRDLIGEQGLEETTSLDFIKSKIKVV